MKPVGALSICMVVACTFVSVMRTNAGANCKDCAKIPELKLVSHFSLPFPVTGVTPTKEGNLAIIQGSGVLYIYSKAGSLLQQYTISTAEYILDIYRDGDTYFVTDIYKDYLGITSGDGTMDIGVDAYRIIVKDNTLWAISPSGLHKFTYDTNYNVNSSKILAKEDRPLFFRLFGLALLSDRLIVTCLGSEHTMHIFALDGTRMFPPIGRTGSADGEFNSPFDVSSDECDRVYVSDKVNGRISLFSNNGTFVKHLLTNNKDIEGSPFTLHYEDGFLYLTANDPHAMYIFELQ